MARHRNKISQGLSDAELLEFLRMCYETEGLTLARVQELAKEKGIEISIMSAKRFMDRTYDEFVTKVRRASEMAAQIEQLTDGNEGKTLADAASGMLGQQVFDYLVETDLQLGNPLDMDAANRLALILRRLRSGDAEKKRLELKVTEFERLEKERKEAGQRKLTEAKDAGLSTEAIKTIEEILGIL